MSFTNFFNFYDVSKYFFNSAKLEEEKNSNFRKYFEKKYSRDKMISDIKVDKKVYKSLRDFFIKFNQDTQIRTFSEFSYSKYKFTTLKIVTFRDITECFNKFTNLGSENFLPKLNNKNLDSSVNWEDFFLTMQNVIEKEKNFNLEEFLSDLSVKTQNKNLNFKNYQKLYKATKRKIILKGIKTLLLENTNDPDFMVIKDKMAN